MLHRGGNWSPLTIDLGLIAPTLEILPTQKAWHDWLISDLLRSRNWQ